MSDVAVTNEPLTYEEHAPHSYFRDLGLRESHADARDRLERHAVEMERRINPNRMQGQGGYFAPPDWLIEKFAGAPRRARVLANLCPKFPLPTVGQSINVPRLTLGNLEAPQEDDSPNNQQDITDAQVQSPVALISGMGDFPLQMLEQSPQGAHLDWAMFKDLTEAYDQSLEQQLIYGNGSSIQPYPQFYGLTNVPNTVGVTATTSASTVTGMYTFLGQMASRIGNNRDQPPGAWLMTTSRWSWIASGLDNQNRPIVTPDVHPPMDGDGNFAVSTLFGWPVYVDDAIPTNLGTAANQDVIIACIPSDLMLLEGEQRTATQLEVLSGTLQVRFQLRNYVAFLAGRYPTGISVLTGAGMVVQSGFTN